VQWTHSNLPNQSQTVRTESPTNNCTYTYVISIIIIVIIIIIMVIIIIIIVIVVINICIIINNTYKPSIWYNHLLTSAQ